MVARLRIPVLIGYPFILSLLWNTPTLPMLWTELQLEPSS